MPAWKTMVADLRLKTQEHELIQVFRSWCYHLNEINERLQCLEASRKLELSGTQNSYDGCTDHLRTAREGKKEMLVEMVGTECFILTNSEEDGGHQGSGGAGAQSICTW